MKTAFSMPSSSAMPEVSTVSSLPTRTVPVMVGYPVAGLFGYGAASTMSVAALVSVSRLPASSAKDTRTRMYKPQSVDARV